MWKFLKNAKFSLKTFIRCVRLRMADWWPVRSPKLENFGSFKKNNVKIYENFKTLTNFYANLLKINYQKFSTLTAAPRAEPRCYLFKSIFPIIVGFQWNLKLRKGYKGMNKLQTLKCMRTLTWVQMNNFIRIFVRWPEFLFGTKNEESQWKERLVIALSGTCCADSSERWDFFQNFLSNRLKIENFKQISKRSEVC